MYRRATEACRSGALANAIDSAIDDAAGILVGRKPVPASSDGPAATGVAKSAQVGDFHWQAPGRLLCATAVLAKGFPMAGSALQDYLRSTSPDRIDTAFVAYLAALSEVATVAPDVAASIVHELGDQRRNLKLIASEN